MKRLLPLLAIVSCAAPPASPPSPPRELVVEPPVVEFPRMMADTNPDPHVVEVNLEAKLSRVEFAPGQAIEAWTYDGGVPGPLLNANVGDRIIVHFKNSLNEPTTVHWHGFRISDQMDGVPTIQKPVAPGETFTYDFVAPDAGSFWYHPHMRSAEQVERGLYGPIVIHERWDQTPDFDADRYFVTDDVRLGDDGTIAPPSTQMPDQVHGRYGNTLLTNGSAKAVPFEFRRGQVERWRLVNTANARTMSLTVEGAKFRIVGVDGGLLPEGGVEAAQGVVELPVGARVELEVRLESAEARLVSLVPYVDANDELQTDRIVIAKGVSVAESGQDPARTLTWPGVAIPALPDAAASGTHLLELDGFNDGTGIKMTINGKVYPEMDMWMTNQNEPVYVTIHNKLGMAEHPFHLHGNFFQIVSRDGVAVNEPGLRDTVLIAPSQTVVIATRFENAGEWMYHCHIHEHSEEGMMGMLTVMHKM